MLIISYGINIGGNKIRRDGLLGYLKKDRTLHEKRFKYAKHIVQ